MSSKCDAYNEDGNSHQSYCDRPEWNDITPIPQDDGETSVVAIAYTDAFIDVYDYFRAIVKKKEYSLRALDLTRDAISMNPANYTVWQYRRQILENIEVDLQLELEFCSEMIENIPKNYQVWHHRRIIVKWLNDPSKELNFTKIIFESDPKNYHAWEHRQWTLKTFNLFDGELKSVHDLLSRDLQNNSAWNQRYFVISNTTGYTQEVVEKEIMYARAAIDDILNNESSWNYLRGVARHDCRSLSKNDSLVQWAYKLRSEDNTSCPLLLSFLLDIVEDKLNKSDVDSLELLREAKKICDNLTLESDRIREYYWKQRLNNINQQHQQ